MFQCGKQEAAKHSFINAVNKKKTHERRLWEEILQLQPGTTPNEAVALNAQCLCGPTADGLKGK